MNRKIKVSSLQVSNYLMNKIFVSLAVKGTDIDQMLADETEFTAERVLKHVFDPEINKITVVEYLYFKNPYELTEFILRWS